MLQHGLTPTEAAQLEAGLPKLFEWSPSILVPMTLQRLRKVEVLWFNEAWFLERGIDPQQVSNRRRISEWLIDQFGFSARLSDHSPSLFSEGEEIFYADRYGNTTGLAVHGGSGRAVVKGGFQVKGIGVTPLAGVGANWNHSHGCASIEEGLREAVYASIAYYEFPHGAVPIIAVLGTELPHPVEGGGAQTSPSRRALIVRPAVIRPAHAERAPLFIRSITGFKNNQLDDVVRTKDVVRKWSSKTYPQVSELFWRIAEQIAFGRVNKLFNGGFFSSNFSIFAELLDFGGMRATSDWARALNLDHASGFGDEMGLVLGVLESLVFYFNKYQLPHLTKLDAESLGEEACEALECAISAEYARMWGLQGSKDVERLPLLMDENFCFEQQRVVNYKHQNPMHISHFYDALLSGKGARSKKQSSTIYEIKKVLEEHYRARDKPLGGLMHSFKTAVRYAMPRQSLYREELQIRLLQLLKDLEKRDEKISAISNFIDGVVGAGRRHWRYLPDGLTVHSHIFAKGSSALVCSDTNQRTGLWIESVVDGHQIGLLGEAIDLEGECTVDVHGRYASAFLHGRLSSDGVCFEPARGGKINLPPMQVTYPDPASDWVI